MSASVSPRRLREILCRMPHGIFLSAVVVLLALPSGQCTETFQRPYTQDGCMQVMLACLRYVSTSHEDGHNNFWVECSIRSVLTESSVASRWASRPSPKKKIVLSIGWFTHNDLKPEKIEPKLKVNDYSCVLREITQALAEDYSVGSVSAEFQTIYNAFASRSGQPDVFLQMMGIFTSKPPRSDYFNLTTNGQYYFAMGQLICGIIETFVFGAIPAPTNVRERSRYLQSSEHAKISARCQRLYDEEPDASKNDLLPRVKDILQDAEYYRGKYQRFEEVLHILEQNQITRQEHLQEVLARKRALNIM